MGGLGLSARVTSERRSQPQEPRAVLAARAAWEEAQCLRGAENGPLAKWTERDQGQGGVWSGGSARHVFQTIPSEGGCGAESVSVTRGSDPTHPAISCGHGHVLCRVPSHPTWTQLLAPIPHCHLRRFLQPSGCVFLLSVLTVSKTSPGQKKGMPVLTCLATRVSEGPIPVPLSTESLHWNWLTCLWLSYYLNPAASSRQPSQIAPRKTGFPLSPETQGSWVWVSRFSPPPEKEIWSEVNQS